MRKFNFNNLTRLLSVLDYEQRKEAREAIREEKILIIDTETTKGKALASMCEKYKVPYLSKNETFEIKDRTVKWNTH